MLILITCDAAQAQVPSAPSEIIIKVVCTDGTEAHPVPAHNVKRVHTEHELQNFGKPKDAEAGMLPTANVVPAQASTDD